MLQNRQKKEVAMFAAGVLLTVLACGTLVLHARQFGSKRDGAVSIGLTLPDQKARVALLEAQTEAEQVFFEQGLAAREEQADIFVLPVGIPRARILQSIQEIGTAVRKDGTTFTIEGMTTGNVASLTMSGTTIEKTAVNLMLKANFQTMTKLFGILGFSGKMMVKDVIPEGVQQAFLAEVENVSPLALGSAEQFLYTDLLEYAADPDSKEQQLFTELSPERAGELRAHLLESGLSSVRASLSPVAKDLKTSGTWPLPLVRIDSIQREGERWNIGLTAFSRKG